MLKTLLAAGAALALSLAAAPASFGQDDYVHQAAQVRAGTYKLDPAHGKITWAVKHLGFSTYRGQFTGTEATLVFDPKDPSRISLQATVQTKSVGTLNPALDAHLATGDFLEVAKFPTATFRSTRVTPTGPASANVAGDLTLHGITRPILMKVTFNQAGVFPMMKQYRVGFDGEATIKRSEFGIMMGIPAVSDEVELKFEGEFAPQD